jgi:hypothetical protein
VVLSWLHRSMRASAAEQKIERSIPFFPLFLFALFF